MRCMACYENIPEGTETCPNCGFVHYQVIGDTEEALSALKLMAGRHRAMFLRRFDLGITVYTWKDRGGTIVQDTVRRVSFGTADALMEGPVWLEQRFARVEDEVLTVELSIEKDGKTRTVPVRLPAPREARLQQLGIGLDEELKLQLMLKNEQSQTVSQPVAFLTA